MKILFVTNYYPPSDYGWGYMQLCEEVADGLWARGHDVAVLTSSHRSGDEIERPYPIFRLLHLDPDWHRGKSAARQFFAGRRQREDQDIAHLRHLVAELQPDIVFFWHYIGIPRAVLHKAEQMANVIVTYYLAGYHPELPEEYTAYWERQPIRPIARLLKRPLSRIALAMLAREGKPIHLRHDYVACVSEYVRNRLIAQDLISSSAVVIHNGVDISQFSPEIGTRPKFHSDGLRCIVAGHIKPDKGVHTVIEAFARLRAEGSPRSITLTVLGSGQRDYVEYLQQRVLDSGLQGSVEFHSAVPREQMPSILARHNTLILPSEYDEPLARAMQEAMAMGLLVISTLTGGSGELLVHERTGLAFEPGSPASLAQQLCRAVDEPDLAEELAAEGHKEVIENYNIGRTIEQVESHLGRILKAAHQDE